MNKPIDTAQALELLKNAPQHNRFLRMSFPKGDGPKALMLPNGLDAVEAVSRDFHFSVEVLSNDARIALKDVQGKMVTVELVREDGSVRYFNGHVFEFRLVSTDGGYAFYAMVLKPWTAYLSLRKDNFLFHGKNIAAQTDEVFRDYLVADWKLQIAGADEPMTDACQFDESDHNYLNRRWEALGWHYWYEHRKDGHTLVLSDDTTAAEPIDGATCEIPWQSEAGSMEDDAIASWTPVRRIMPTRVAFTSFDFKNPRPLSAELPTINQQGDVLDLEVYEWLGAKGFKNSSEGDALVRQRMEELEARGKHFEASGNDRYVSARRWFRFTGHFDQAPAGNDDAEREFLILEVRHHARNNYLLEASAQAFYKNAFTCIRKKIPWRPGLNFNSALPKIYGIQTAIVVGPKGEEIHTDKYGRVKVQFHWDREGQYDEKSSAWIRVGSAWTGKGYGFIGIPRVGQEVVVQFLDGNPDRPLITSCLFNEDNLPAWGFPEAAHRTGIQTRSTPGGAGHCEMVIHDKAGHELLNIRSQKDMVTTVLHDHSTTVENNKATVINGPQHTVAVTTGTQATTVKKAIQVTSETEGIEHTAHTAYKVTASTQHILLEAATDIILKVGQSTLHMSQDGAILLEGVTITVKGSGKVDVNP
jgi:type VI secretion system secreted protein VgrG